MFSPLMEMSYCKCTEAVFKAIPASVVQIYALLGSGNVDKAAVLSILASTAATAYTSVMISYDWDTSRRRARQTTRIYSSTASFRTVPWRGRHASRRCLCSRSRTPWPGRSPALSWQRYLSRGWLCIWAAICFSITCTSYLEAISDTLPTQAEDRALF